MSAPLTRTSTPRLSEVARHVVVPQGVTSTGWPAVRDRCSDLGIRFRWWQHEVGKIVLAKRVDGKYAATIGGTGLSIPRQVGKTFLVGAIMFALCLLRPNLTVIWTAHRLRTAAETFGKMQKFAGRASIAPHVHKIVLGSGEESIEFVNGSRILFGARERGFGRGFDEVDVVVYDEGQILTENALDDMIPAMNQSRQDAGALLLFMGTPPKPTDRGEVFTRMRTEALSGEDGDTGWVEFGASPNFVPTPLPAPLSEADWRAVEQANPSYPDDTPHEAILRMRKKLGHESFLREGLGIWEDVDGATVFGVGRWAACRRPFELGLPVKALALAVSLDQSAATVSAAAVGHQVVVKPLQHGPGTLWTVQRLKELQRVHKVPVIVDGRGPAASLIRDLEAAKVRLHVCTASDTMDAWDTLFKLVTDADLAHGDYPELNEAVAAAATRTVGERTALGRRKATADISALESVMLAAWWATRPKSATQPQRLPHQVAKTKATNPLLTRGF